MDKVILCLEKHNISIDHTISHYDTDKIGDVVNRDGKISVLIGIIVACSVCACLDSTPSQPLTTADKIAWYSYEEGMKIAEEQNKPVMIGVYANWCGWCRELDRVVYTDPDVIELADEFVCIKINDDERRDLAVKYNPSGGVPATVFLRADGTEIHRIRGYPGGGAEAFVREMMIALNKI